jgi:hypothetical protein
MRDAGAVFQDLGGFDPADHPAGFIAKRHIEIRNLRDPFAVDQDA